jgi:transposase
MTVFEQYRALSTSLVRRFEAVRAERSMDEIGKEMGVGFPTLYAWLAQDRTTRIEVLAKIETWVERQEVAHAHTHE